MHRLHIFQTHLPTQHHREDSNRQTPRIPVQQPPPAQSSVRISPHKSATDSIVRLHTDADATSLHFKCYVMVTFLDVKRPFNKMWPEGMFHKLQSAGVPTTLTRLINSFLTCRCTELRPGCTRVPQGSILSHLLFIFFYHDSTLFKEPTDHLLQFTEDTALWLTNQSSAEGSRILPYELRRLEAIKHKSSFYATQT